MPRASGRPQEISLPGLTRGGPPAAEAVVEKPSRPVRPVVAKVNVEEDDSRNRASALVAIEKRVVLRDVEEILQTQEVWGRHLLGQTLQRPAVFLVCTLQGLRQSVSAGFVPDR